MLEIISSVYQEVLIVIVLGSIGGFTAWLRNIKITQDSACKRLWRLEKAFSLFVKLELNQTKRDHPETDVSEIELMIEEIMDDD